MYRNLLRLLGYLVISYLLTACQAKQYGLFRASNSLHNQPDQGESSNPTTPEIAEKTPVSTADSTALVVEPSTKPISSVDGTGIKIKPVSSADRLMRKTEKKAYRKAVRAKLRKAVKLAPLEPTQGKTNGLAKAAFILGLVTLVLFFTPVIGGLTLLTGPLALILGIVSLGQIKRKNQKGKGFGIVGTTLGAIYVLIILLIIAAIASVLRR